MDNFNILININEINKIKTDFKVRLFILNFLLVIPSITIPYNNMINLFLGDRRDEK